LGNSLLGDFETIFGESNCFAMSFATLNLPGPAAAPRDGGGRACFSSEGDGGGGNFGPPAANAVVTEALRADLAAVEGAALEAMIFV
jgi:hypothetical protein